MKDRWKLMEAGLVPVENPPSRWSRVSLLLLWTVLSALNRGRHPDRI